MTQVRLIKQAPSFQFWEGRKEEVHTEWLEEANLSTSLSPINSCFEHEVKVGWTYECLILNRRSPLIRHSIDGNVLLGWHWISQYHYIAFIHGNAIILQLCNKGRVLCIFKELPHFPIFLIACEDIVLFLATFAVAAYFSEIYGNSNKVTVSAESSNNITGNPKPCFLGFDYRIYKLFCNMPNISWGYPLFLLLCYLHCLFTEILIR